PIRGAQWRGKTARAREFFRPGRAFPAATCRAHGSPAARLFRLHTSERSRLMFDLMTAAFQTDSTRVVTFQMALEQSNRAYREIGISDSHHGLTHHGGDKEKIEKCILINHYEAEQFAYWIGKLKTTKAGDGTLF